MSLLVSSVLLCLWIVLMLLLVYRLGGQVAVALYSIADAIPIARHLLTPVLALVLLPWIGLHELAHAVVLKLAGARIRRVRLYPVLTERGLLLGQTECEGEETTFYGLAVAAPLLLGNAVLALLLRHVFRVPWSRLFVPPAQVPQAAIAAFPLAIRNWNPLGLYLLVCAGNGAMPGSTDWQMIRRFLTTILAILVIAAGGVSSLTWAAGLGSAYLAQWLSVLSLLAIQLSMVVVVDTVLWLLLLLPASLARGLRSRRSGELASKT